MQKKDLLRKEYTKPNVRFVVFNYKEVVMASDPETYDYNQVNESDPNATEESEEGPVD